TLASKRRIVRKQLVQHSAERVDIGARIDILCFEIGLLGAHILGRSHEHAKVGELRRIRQWLTHRLGDTEIDYLGHRIAVPLDDENVRWLDVAVNDTLLMRMLNRLANRNE